MATTMVPETPGATPAPSPTTSSSGMRFVAIHANLMPEEIVTARAVVAIRKQVLYGLVVVVALLIAWFGLSWWQTNTAQGNLDDLQSRGAALQNQTQQFAPLVKAQDDAATIRARLQKLMAGDVSWTAMLTSVRGVAPAGITFTQVNATVVAGAATVTGGTSNGSYNSLNQSGLQQIGTLTIAGTSNDKRLIANFNDRLGSVKGLTSPFITGVTTAGSTTNFTITAIITSAALGGRYAVATTTAGAATAPGTVPAAATTTGGK